MIKEVTLERLAKALYETMQRLDPPTDPSEIVEEWSSLDDLSRAFYVACAEAVMIEWEDIQRKNM